MFYFHHMKILHTADWHIGKTLYKYALRDEINLFFDWMIDLIVKEKIDILLVSGDIFDLANPANVDRQAYYRILARLNSLNIQCVITAGNHDSPSLLESPQDLLKELNIHVIGSGENPERQIIRIYNKDQTQSAVILAVPYLRDSYVRKVSAAETYQTRVEGLREGIIQYYKDLKVKARELYPNDTLIAMGHLYVQGAHLSDSERDIQIGNEAGIGKERFTELFDYFALGHIHRPQKLNSNGTFRYSGSPIPLSFSERKDDKQVVILEISEGKTVKTKEIKVPAFRSLRRFSGALEAVKKELNEYRSTNPLKTLAEIHIKEEQRDQSKILETIALTEKDSPHYMIISYKIEFQEKLESLSNRGLDQYIEEMKPREVFEARLNQEELTTETKGAVLEAFDLVYNQVQEAE